jgi:hypothetical protein
MSLRRREQRALQQIGQALSRSDPLLDEEFRAFGQVCLHAAMPSREQIPPSRKDRWSSMWQRLSHSALLALAYAGGATWLDDLAEDHESQHAGGQ